MKNVDLKTYISNSAPVLKTIAQKRDVDGTMVDRALEIVRKFIIDRRLILFGGLAIDYALRLKGSSIYGDERPDYDFLSTRSVDDAYELADMLHQAGFEGVGCIRAIHIQTMRVRVNYHYVADIGYAPQTVFDHIPTLEYQGIRIVHPDYQRLDMHLSFCFPFNGPPREDVFSRWKKDNDRFNLFEEYYPVVATPVIHNVFRVTVDVSEIDKSTYALHGFAAIAALCQELGSADTPKLYFNKSENKIEFDSPIQLDSLYIASSDPDIFSSASIKTYPYMDTTPVTLRKDNIIVYQTKSRLLSVVMASEVQVVSTHYILLYLMEMSYRTDNEAHRDIYRQWYCYVLKMIDQAESNAKTTMSFCQGPFGPSLKTMGDVNHDAAYLIKIAGYAERLKEPVELSLKNLPENYYPIKAKGVHPTFDYNVFKRAGQKVEE